MRLFTKDGVYYVGFRAMDGRERTVSTKCTNEADARKVVNASGIKDLELAARAGRLTAEAIGQITAGKKLNMEKAVAQFPEYLQSIRKSPRTIDNTVSVVARWVSDCKLEKHAPSLITEKHINDWLNAGDSSNVSTRKWKMSCIRQLFRWMCGNGWLPRDPSLNARVDYTGLSFEQKEPKEMGTFTREEVKQLIKQAHRQGDIFWQFAIPTSYNFALRLGDVAEMEWSSFAKPGKLIVWTGKRDKRVALPVSAAMAKLFTEIPVRDRRFVFPEQREAHNDINRRSLLPQQFRRICQSCGIEGKSFHWLRHTRITEWTREGKSLEDIGELVGHSDTRTTSGYVHK